MDTKLEKQRGWLEAVADVYRQQQEGIKKLTGEERFRMAVISVAEREKLNQEELQSGIDLFVSAVKVNPTADSKDRGLAKFAKLNFSNTVTTDGQAAEKTKKPCLAVEQMTSKMNEQATWDKNREVRELPQISTVEMQAGAYTMGRSAASSLSNPMSAAKGVGTFGFCSAVGGVAFGAVAISADGSVIKGFTYNAQRQDGSRLEALVLKGGNQYRITLPVYDWELVPTARFAQGDQDVVVTFFGSLLDKNEEERLRAKGCRFMNYHKDVDNTLMGLRVLQADLLAFHPAGLSDFTENGVVIKGAGEPFVANKLSQEEQKYYGSSGAKSYVICDVGIRIGFKITDNMQLVFSGDAVWSCWKSNLSRQKARTYEVEFLNQINTPEGNLKLQNEFAEKLTPLDKVTVQNNEELFRTRFMEYGNNKKRDYMNEKYQETFMQLPAVSSKLSSLMKANEGGNPPVYRALSKFMRYAALFRYVKQQDADGYAAFVDTLSGVKPRPSIETPTVMYPPEYEN